MGLTSNVSLETVVAVGDPPEAGTCPFQGVAREVVAVRTPEEGLRAAQATEADLVLVRETVPRDAALAFVRQARLAAPDRPLVVLSAEPAVDEAILFIRNGASDYLAAPPDEQALQRAVALAPLHRRREDAARFLAPECPDGVHIVGQSDGLRQVLKTLHQVAESRCNPAVIVGETGTGKELAARALHVLRGGSADDFVAVNCATLTANLLESELFGHVKGAFTGADRDKQGLFEMAGTGSVFLDEIREMPTGLQAKLLRVLQEREFRRVGGTETISCRAAVIASSNRDLAVEAREGRFRQDLYYRLAIFPVHLPPLRAPQRREDVPLLAEYFIETSNLPRAEQISGLAPEARVRLLAHTWPGNVRELKNVVERALITETADQITPGSLIFDHQEAPVETETAVPVPENDFSLETAERLFITRALRETGWQRTRAAALLGITRATLHAKLKRYKIRIPDSQDSTSSAGSKSSSRSARLQEAGV
ncbi:MAG: sigma-54 dependent transcriptional regulator [Phycisphaerae bacterium]